MNASTTCKSENIINSSDMQWDKIDWTSAEETVNHLQTRIAKAKKNGQVNLAKRLQHLLTNSFYAKCIAVRKVTTKSGRYISGVDKTLWTSSKLKMKAVNELSPMGDAEPNRWGEYSSQRVMERWDPEHPNYARQSNAGTICPGIGPYRRGQRRSPLIRV